MYTFIKSIGGKKTKIEDCGDVVSDALSLDFEGHLFCIFVLTAQFSMMLAVGTALMQEWWAVAGSLECVR